MTTYIIGAFEALFWAWRMFRDKTTEEGREEIQIILARLGKSEQIDFEELRLKMGE